MLLTRVVAAGALIAGATILPACEQSAEPPAFVTSGDCADEQRVVAQALDRSHLTADVNGDGRPDTVAVASQPGAAKPCRAFVGVRVAGGSTYSTHLVPNAVPVEGLRARVIGLPRLGGRRPAEIVVDTAGAVDAVLAQLFALGGGRLYAVPVRVPGFSGGTFIVTGGGVMFPQGAGCTADGRMVLSAAAQSADGTSFRVTRRTYQVRGQPLRLVAPVVERATVPVDQLTARFPEFAGEHWTACSGPAGT